jgi:RNA polymerase sigma-70 factor (ECF subfamily)
MNRDLQDSDDQLLRRIRGGDEAAFLCLYHRRQGGIFRFVLQMGGSEAVAEDVTQEVFLALIRDDFGYSPERGTLSGYLYGIARKLLLRHLERERANTSVEAEPECDEALPAGGDDVLSDLTRQESIEAIRQAVLALPRRYREVIVLCDLQEMEYEEAAAALGCAVGTVRSRLHRGRAMLVEKLNRGGDSSPALGGLRTARCLI